MMMMMVMMMMTMIMVMRMMMMIMVMMMMMMMSDLVMGAENPLAILTNYLRVKTISGCEGDLLDIRCHSSDNKVT